MTTGSKASQPARHPHISELTGLRGLAALHVYFMHFYGVFCDYADSAQNVTDYGPDTPPLTPFFIGNSQNSVTLFFVLSGFVLTIIYSQGFANRSETKSYYMKRIARIAPVYWFCLLFFLPFIFTSFWWNDFLNIFGGEGHKIAALILTPFGLQSWSPLHVFWQQWNPPAWSVSCEFFFYLAFPFLIHRKGLAVKTWKAFAKT
ncbi:MAG: acyltransferase, partial [Deltaproteobacteria bacterium]|nr:acyltransferase [Deltaproteobacteria bacterium]